MEYCNGGDLADYLGGKLKNSMYNLKFLIIIVNFLFFLIVY
jgi:hypothetical protein